MISLSLSLKLTTPTTWLTFKPLPPPPPPPPPLSLSLSLLLLPTFFNPNCNRRRIQDNSNQRRRGRRNGSCRAAGFSDDVPLAIAIGACALTSLVFPISPSPTDEDDDDDDDDDGDSVIDSTDTRLAVMGIISFIPYFNWLSWVFAWLDTGNRRYAVYAIVYLAPYLRSNLSLSPEESWLPVASIVFCIIHIQLEASIKNGDLQGFQLFNQAANRSSSSTRKEETRLKGHQGVSEEARTKDPMNLPASQDQSRDEIKGWGVPRKPLQDPKYLNEDEDANGGQKY